MSYKLFCQKFASLYYSFSINTLNEISDCIDWSLMSLNEKIQWSFEDFISFSDKWDFGFGNEEYPMEINLNPALPWSLELLKYFEDKWQWELISQNEHIPWKGEIILEFKDKLYFDHLSGLRNIQCGKTGQIDHLKPE